MVRAGGDPALRAEHLGHAGDEQAAAAYVEAARFHIAGYRFERASSLIERGLTLDCGRADRFALACLHGRTLDALGPIRSPSPPSKRRATLPKPMPSSIAHGSGWRPACGWSMS